MGNKKNHKKTKKRPNNSYSNEIGIVKKDKKKKILSFIFNLIFYVLMLSIFFGAGLMAVMQKQDKALNGYRMFGVLTNSMVSPDNTIKKGGFRAGDVVIIKEVEAKDLKKGDVITYRPNTNPNDKKNNYLTHRVVKVQNGLKGEKGYFITTRGDANSTDDMPISEKALVGKVVGRIPKIGAILSYVKENFALSVIFILSVVGFFWVIRMYIMSGDDPAIYKNNTIKRVEVVPERTSSKKKSSRGKSNKTKTSQHPPKKKVKKKVKQKTKSEKSVEEKNRHSQKKKKVRK